MERFVKRHEHRIIGILSGFDRLLFRGNLASICHQGGMDLFLSSQRIVYKDFSSFAQRVSDRLKPRAEQIAQQAGRPLIYEPSSKKSKEESALQIAKKDNLREGLICVLSCVEPCQSFGIAKIAPANSFLGWFRSASVCICTFIFSTVNLASCPSAYRLGCR